MILADLHSESTYMPFFHHPLWNEIIDWLKKVTPETAEGIYELHGKDVYVNVHGYKTLPRNDCQYESHRKYIDLQYCITGGELIEWAPIGILEPKREYNIEKDVIHYFAPPLGTTSSLVMGPGKFVIFYPEDGHMPKIILEGEPSVKKLVVKINKQFLGMLK